MQTIVVEDSRKAKAKRRVWSLGDYNTFLTRGLISVNNILTVDFVRKKIFNFFIK